MYKLPFTVVNAPCSFEKSISVGLESISSEWTKSNGVLMFTVPPGNIPRAPSLALPHTYISPFFDIAQLISNEVIISVISISVSLRVVIFLGIGCEMLSSPIPSCPEMPLPHAKSSFSLPWSLLVSVNRC